MSEPPFEASDRDTPFDWRERAERLRRLTLQGVSPEQSRAEARVPRKQAELKRHDRPGDPFSPANPEIEELARQVGDRKASWMERLLAMAGVTVGVTQGKSGSGRRPGRAPYEKGFKKGYAPQENRELDPVGFYSHQLEALKSMAQEGRQQGSAEAWRKEFARAEVKPEEMAATGMDQFLQTKREFTRQELEDFARQNRVQVRETKYGDPSPERIQRRLDEYADDSEHGNAPELSDLSRDHQRDIIKSLSESDGLAGPIKWKQSGGQDLLLDPENPSNREAVLHQAPNPRLAEIEVEMKRLQPLVHDAAIDKAKADEYRGLRNQQEALNTELQTLSKGQYQEPHFPEAPGYLTHTRGGTYRTENGKLVWHGDEVQSTRAQAIRDAGGPRDDAQTQANIDQLKRRRDDAYAARAEMAKEAFALGQRAGLHRGGKGSKYMRANGELEVPAIHTSMDWLSDAGKYGDEIATKAKELDGKMSSLLQTERLAQAEYETAMANAKGAPVGHPLVNDMSRANLTGIRQLLLQTRGKPDVEGVTLTPGDLQNERYGLSRHAQALRYNPETGQLQFQEKGAGPHGGWREAGRDMSPDQLRGYVGGEAAASLLRQPVGGGSRPHPGWQSLEGVELEIGGQGMREYYDKTYPNVMNKELQRLDPNYPGQGRTQLRLPPDSQPGDNTAYEVRGHGTPDRHAVYEQPMHHFPLTPKIKEEIAKGLPLFNVAGIAGLAGIAEMERRRREQEDEASPFGPSYPDL